MIDKYWAGVAGVALAGVSFAIAISSLHAAIQLLAPRSQRGRAIALYLIALRTGNGLGVLIEAGLAGLVSVSIVISGAGVALLAVALLLAFKREWIAPIDADALTV